jgi:hypothetical protein
MPPRREACTARLSLLLVRLPVLMLMLAPPQIPGPPHARAP